MKMRRATVQLLLDEGNRRRPLPRSRASWIARLAATVGSYGDAYTQITISRRERHTAKRRKLNRAHQPPPGLAKLSEEEKYLKRSSNISVQPNGCEDRQLYSPGEISPIEAARQASKTSARKQRARAIGMIYYESSIYQARGFDDPSACSPMPVTGVKAQSEFTLRRRTLAILYNSSGNSNREVSNYGAR